MSPSEHRPPAGRANDEYGWIDRYAADLHRSAKELVAKGEAARVSDEALARVGKSLRALLAGIAPGPLCEASKSPALRARLPHL